VDCTHTEAGGKELYAPDKDREVELQSVNYR